MLHGCPYVLQGGAHLHLEADGVELRLLLVGVERLGDAADVVERVVAEAAHLVHLALVDRLVPVHVKHPLHIGGHAVHVVAIERDYSEAHEVGDVVEGVILVPLSYQFAYQAVSLLDASFYRGYFHVVFGQCLLDS